MSCCWNLYRHVLRTYYVQRLPSYRDFYGFKQKVGGFVRFLLITCKQQCKRNNTTLILDSTPYAILQFAVYHKPPCLSQFRTFLSSQSWPLRFSTDLVCPNSREGQINDASMPELFLRSSLSGLLSMADSKVPKDFVGSHRNQLSSPAQLKPQGPEYFRPGALCQQHGHVMLALEFLESGDVWRWSPKCKGNVSKSVPLRIVAPYLEV